MKCPVCKHHNEAEIDLHSDGFYEHIFACDACGATWSVNHGTTEVIKDPHKGSFMQGITEAVEGDDYNQMG